MKPRICAALIGVLLAAALALGARAAAHGAVRGRHDICVSCGIQRSFERVLGIPTGSSIEETEWSRWILSHGDGEHEHVWVYSHSTFRGWKSHGVGCAGPTEAHLAVLWLAHERLGDDAVLAELVRDFLSTPHSDADRRAEIVAAASALGRGSEDE
jgi:hypothetical protein